MKKTAAFFLCLSVIACGQKGDPSAAQVNQHATSTIQSFELSYDKSPYEITANKVIQKKDTAIPYYTLQKEEPLNTAHNAICFEKPEEIKNTSLLSFAITALDQEWGSIDHFYPIEGTSETVLLPVQKALTDEKFKEKKLTKCQHEIMHVQFVVYFFNENAQTLNTALSHSSEGIPEPVAAFFFHAKEKHHH